MQIVRERYKQVRSIIGNVTVSTTAIPEVIEGRNITINVLTGNLWINPNATAVADATAIKLVGTGTNKLDIYVSHTLSMISDATGATVQIIIWEE